MATTLTYFDIPTSRGEECRLALFLAGVEFHDERLNRDQWAAKMPSSPYGALPILSIDGKSPIGESNAILRYVGSQYGLHPSDIWEAARHEALMGSVEDFRHTLGPTQRIKDPEEKKKAREDFAQNYFPRWAGFVEKQIQGPFFGGEKLQVADLKLFVALGPISRGAIDHIPADVVAPFPKLKALFEAVKAHAKVAAWYARAPKAA